MPDANHSTPEITDLLGGMSIIPVLTIMNPASAVPLAEALVAGGLTVLEVTLRTPAALPAIRAISDLEANIVVGAGTVTTADEVRAAANAGARFAVSPGLFEPVLEAARDAGLPCLPGVATATEMMHAQALRLTHLKFFPASVAGGVPGLRAFAGPFPRLNFCPTGGIDRDNCRDYLALPNVFAVGGSWVAPADAVADSDWRRIMALAREAVAMTARSDPKLPHRR